MTPPYQSQSAAPASLRRSRPSDRSVRGKPVRTLVRPTVSVVLTSAVGRPPVEGCLAALASSAAQENLDVLVVRAGTARQLPTLRRVYSGVRIMTADADASPSDLRAIGFREATGDIVIFIENEASIDSVMERIRPKEAESAAADVLSTAVASPRP